MNLYCRYMRPAQHGTEVRDITICISLNSESMFSEVGVASQYSWCCKTLREVTVMVGRTTSAENIDCISRALCYSRPSILSVCFLIFKRNSKAWCKWRTRRGTVGWRTGQVPMVVHNFGTNVPYHTTPYHTIPCQIPSAIVTFNFELSSSTDDNRDSSVGIELGYGLDDRGSRARFPAGAGNFSFHYRVQNGSGANPASYPMRARGSFPGVKWMGREADHSPPSSAEVK
jgi:hypothetical protein